MKEFFEQLYIRRILQYLLYLFLALVVQNMLFTQIRPLDVCPMVLPAVCAALGMFQGSTWGTVFALILGVFADMAFVENTMLFTILFPALAFFSGFACQFFVNRRFFAFMGLATAACLATAVVQMIATMVGDTWSPVMLRTVVLQTLWSVPPAVLAYFPPARWIQ
jgi:cell shape-determining protein MreD